MDLQQSINTAPKITEWVNEPTLQLLKTDLEFARPSQNAQISKIRHWNDLMQVTGKAKIKPVPGRSSVQPKLIRRQAEWRYSALTEPFLGTNKLFKVEPTTFEDEEGSAQNELVLNYQFRTKMNKVQLIDNLIRAVVDDGTAVIRVGWKRATAPLSEEVPEWAHYPIEDQQQMQLLQQAIALKQDNPREFNEKSPPDLVACVDLYEQTGQATYAEQIGVKTITTEAILENYPTVEVMNPNNVYIDPSCNGDYSKALFTIISFETNKADLLKEGDRYTNLDLVDFQGNSPLSTPDHATNSPDPLQTMDSMRKRVVAYEYWGFYDINSDGVLKPIVCTWIGNVMIRLEESPFPDEKLPFVVIPYLPVKRDLFGEPDAELLEDNQKILGAVSRGMIDLLGRSANSQQGIAKGLLDPMNRRRYDNGQDYEYNPVQTGQEPIINHKYPEIPQSAMLMAQMQNQEAEALTGVKSFGGGISGEAYGDVAAGIRGVLDAASKREMAILRRIAKGVADVGNKIIAMNSVFLSDTETIRITNGEFVEVKREDLKGNFDLIVDISTAEVDNAKAQDLAFMLQTIGPKAETGITMMILAEIAMLKRMPGLAHKLKTYKPQPSPEELKIQQLEIQKLEMENQKLASEIELNKAKAAEALAKKDMTDLDFVEQETGTKHARDMDKQKAQSQGNQNLAVTKALTTPLKKDQLAPDIEAAVGFNRISDKLSEGAPALFS